MAWVAQDKIYLMGGRNGGQNVYSVNTLQFDSNENIDYDTPIKNTTIACIFCHSFVLSDHTNVLILRLFQDLNTPLNHTMVYNYDTATHVLSERTLDALIPAPVFTTSAISAGKESVYLFGGYYNGQSSGHIFRIDTSTLAVTNLSSIEPYPLVVPMFGCAVTLKSGIIVLGFLNDQEIVDTDQVRLYNPATNTISVQKVTGYRPNPRQHLTCNLGPDQTTIYYFGGYLVDEDDKESNDFNVLDTNTWEWVGKQVPGLAARPRSGPVAAVTNDKLVIIGGETRMLEFNDICVVKGLPKEGDSIRTSELYWFTHNPYYDEVVHPPTKLSTGGIVGVVLGVVAVFFIIMFIVYKKSIRFRVFTSSLGYEFIWNPRTGEPNWVELSRLIVRLLGFALSMGFLIYIIVRSINSATVKQEAKEDITTLSIPDVRICLIGYDVGTIRVHCEFVNGTWCDDSLTILDTSIHAPKYIHRKEASVYCKLFVPDERFKFTSDKHNYIELSTTGITFNLYGNRTTPNIQGLIQIDLYENRNDPNIPLFNINTTAKTKLSDLEIRKWDSSELNSQLLYNPIVIPEGDYMDILYIEKEYELLKSDGWNTVGAYSKYNKISTMGAKLVSSPGDMTDPEFLGSITIQPESFSKYVYTEEKVFTLLYGIAQMGGILGICVAIETIFFGFRPQSPLGMVHRFSNGKFQNKLKDKLKGYFGENEVEVPMIAPVSRRFKTMKHLKRKSEMHEEEETEKEKLRKMEERIQLMEFLLKSYYLDDEVFKYVQEAKENKDAQEAKEAQDKKKAQSSSIMNMLSGMDTNEKLDHHR
ncbi:hypothetical protein BDB01DRAFT_836117 [Pilobolus umbonatus]|nr:hypothetical protein BDB01DRAFT_836117 [Pilobolus umbonatus]